MASRGSGTAWGSFLTGLASVVTLPLAIYLTRFSDTYELLHAGLAIPVATGLGLVSLGLARRSRRPGVLSLGEIRPHTLARVGRVLGIVGICMAAAGVVSLVVYDLLEYVGSRE